MIEWSTKVYDRVQLDDYTIRHEVSGPFAHPRGATVLQPVTSAVES